MAETKKTLPLSQEEEGEMATVGSHLPSASVLETTVLLVQALGLVVCGWLQSRLHGV